jgi:antirestriction protein ArdC
LAQALERRACRRAHHAALRGNGIPYQGINVLMLWSAAIDKGYAAPVWMTFKQALELKAHVCVAAPNIHPFRRPNSTPVTDQIPE